jgi:hypothetical protein
VWIDDGDGKQEPGEPGLAGVPVELWYDSNGDGVIDAIYPTGGSKTTGPAGEYVFDNLPAGIYEVRIPTPPSDYTQTGDPDQPGVPCATCDNKTTTPIVLAPGDVYLNADFGYQPKAGFGASIGNRIWLDADADGVGPADTPGGGDPSEKGISGVTVALIRDANNDGVWQPATEPIIATTITDKDGYYLFTGVPVADGAGTDDYLVLVNDTNAVLTGLKPTYDNNGVATPNISRVQDLAPAGNLDQDFGYTPAGQQPNRGLIGDTIFLDRNNDNSPGAGEGLEGVTVRLHVDTNGDGNFDTGEPVYATTVTDENGNYWFPNLPAGNYVVMVDTTTLPGGLTNSYDPDTTDSPANESGVTLVAGQVNLDQDFGYKGTGSIGNLVWNDVDANGIKDPAETGIDGVTVDLYWDVNGTSILDAGDKLAGTTTTASGGAYSFNNLGIDDGGGDIKYFVHVSDTANLLDGWWHSTGASGQDNNSQVDPYLVTLTTTTTTNNTADFGYFNKPAALGNFVWNDLNGNGIQESDEPGIPNVVVTLTITWPNSGGTTLVQTTTGSNGEYAFKNLLLDENMAVATGSDRPSFVVTFTKPSGTTFTLQNQGSDADKNSDADPISGATSTIFLAAGQTDNRWDAGLLQPASIGDKVWVDTNGNGIQDGGESGLSGVTVNLYKTSDPSTPVATTTTDANGIYKFENQPAGSYFVEFVPPTGYSFTQPDQGGNDALDSDANVATGRTPSATVAAGATNNDFDAGLLPVNQQTDTAIGNLVWCDLNNNAIRDDGEPGQAGVTVRLYGLGGDNTPYTGDDVLLRQVVTVSGGFYLFAGVPAGQYYVAVDSTTVPPSCGTASSTGATTDPDIGDHALPSGDDGGTGQKPNETVSGVITVAVNGQVTADTDDPLGYTDDSSYMTADFGFTTSPTSVELRELNAAPQTIGELLLDLLRSWLQR